MNTDDLLEIAKKNEEKTWIKNHNILNAFNTISYEDEDISILLKAIEHIENFNTLVMYSNLDSELCKGVENTLKSLHEKLGIRISMIYDTVKEQDE